MSCSPVRPFSVLVALFCLCSSSTVNAQTDYDGPPINYQSAPVDDAVARLKDALDRGERTLQWNDKNGWLSSILDALNVPAESQTLVFSKTSLQISRISPRRPRALYFNDDVYVGWVQSGDVVELSAVDPQQGAIFYTIRQQPDSESAGRPTITRDPGHCNVCHASSRTQNVPGFLVRSTFPGRDGTPHYSLGTKTTDHTTPISDRFGGWYVTGTHGTMRHNGNAIADEDATPAIDRDQGANRTSLDEFIDVDRYAAPGSDIVALMVLEHQSQLHNAITKANYEARRAAHQDAVMNKLLGRDADYVSESHVRRIASVGDNLLDYLLFADEFVLTDPVIGDVKFQDKFLSRGKTDRQGRSLREFDLRTRIFKYPCSYLIHSDSYQGLPTRVRDYVEQRLAMILNGQDESGDFDHLDAATRQAIGQILADTLDGFADKLAETVGTSR
tara:strand:+ start:648886 stop:650220 length:1335 start_codon:yes stop_codon:yes gene_type:complete